MLLPPTYFLRHCLAGTEQLSISPRSLVVATTFPCFAFCQRTLTFYNKSSSRGALRSEPLDLLCIRERPRSRGCHEAQLYEYILTTVRVTYSVQSIEYSGLGISANDRGSVTSPTLFGTMSFSPLAGGTKTSSQVGDKRKTSRLPHTIRIDRMLSGVGSAPGWIAHRHDVRHSPLCYMELSPHAGLASVR